ncbi:hypothetical protein SAMN05421858_5096 [Haladaptatus litoreus]|uniref:Uncharacterized protein n=1 Tax=Haladaptatus litoreus TaxID=553468 RepID=A0A1N7FID1_9EURY|nr:hypothetical protein [Haladaptatus litoreus]SIS00112.1 hypothetical protein SAMN05421858_5096 [Haladaptatus litoreus]
MKQTTTIHVSKEFADTIHGYKCRGEDYEDVLRRELPDDLFTEEGQ